MFSNTGETLESDWDEMVMEDQSKNIERPKPNLTLTDVIQIIEDHIDLEDDLEFTSESDENEKMAMTDVKFDVEEPESIWFIVEDMPVFRPSLNKDRKSGDADLKRFLVKSTKYPAEARDAGIMGRVWVSFIVDKKGRVTEVMVKRGVHPSLDDEALRVVESLPDFKPGEQRAHPVNVSYTVPINFVLN